jgi:hypothetical protein
LSQKPRWVRPFSIPLVVGLVALAFDHSSKAEFTDAYVQVSIFHRAGFGVVRSGFGRFGSGFSGVPSQFSWGDTITQADGPIVTYGFGGQDLLLGPEIAGYWIKNGTGVWQWGSTGFSTAQTNVVTSGTFTWNGTNVFTGICWIHYIIQGRVGPHQGDQCEFTSDVQFHTASGTVPLHLHYLNTQPGATFSGVDLYAQAPFIFQAVNGNSSVEVDMNENTTFSVTDPGQGSLSGVGNMGPVKGDGGPAPTPPPIAARPSRALNISTRMPVLSGDNVLIGGFIITGPDPKRVLIRALGPSLSGFGVPNALPDPTLELRDNTGASVAFNNDWMESQAAEIQNSGLAPSDVHESAMIRTLAPGAYTATVKGNGNTTGVGIVELYDIDATSGSILANISTRGFAATGDNVMIGGFIIGDEGSDAARVIIRAIGPSLTQFGIANPLGDPTLELHNGNGALILSNDNWKETQQAEIEAANLAPSNDLESAIAASLPVGNYTAIVRGAGQTSGVAVVEACRLP